MSSYEKHETHTDPASFGKMIARLAAEEATARRESRKSDDGPAEFEATVRVTRGSWMVCVELRRTYMEPKMVCIQFEPPDMRD